MVQQVWQRKCPMCTRKLEKETLAEPWRCECGWTTEDVSRDPNRTKGETPRHSA